MAVVLGDLDIEGKLWQRDTFEGPRVVQLGTYLTSQYIAIHTRNLMPQSYHQ